VGLCLVIYLVQTVLSSWWLSRWRYGPAEWLWRSVTYLRLLPMGGGVHRGSLPRTGEGLVRAEAREP
jgi:uncharacterized protein